MIKITQREGELNEDFSGLEMIVEDDTSGEYKKEIIRLSYLDLNRMLPEFKIMFEELSTSFNSNWKEDTIKKVELVKHYQEFLKKEDSKLTSNLSSNLNQNTLSDPVNIFNLPKITAEQAIKYSTSSYLFNNLDARILHAALDGKNKITLYLIISSYLQDELESRGFKIKYDGGSYTTTIYWGDYKPYEDIQLETFEAVKE